MAHISLTLFIKKILIVLVILAVLCGGTFLYITRPVSAPSGDAPTPDATTPDTNPVNTVTPTTEGQQTFAIVASKSQAKFEIDEVLSGEPFHVVGTTADVSGTITVDEENPEKSKVGTISINARTLKTDSTRRDGMIGRMILKAETNEFITFTPASFSGLPANPVVGQEYSFQTTGTLTVAGTSKEVAFDVTAKADSMTSISGTAKSVIKYQDFGITIPEVPMVASVEDDVTLTLDFVAEKK